MLWTLLACGDALIAKNGVEPSIWPTDRLVEADAVPDDARWVDARTADAFALGHVPGAAQVHWTELAGFDEDGLWGPAEVEAATSLLAERGLTDGDGPVLVYDDPTADDYYGGDGYLYWTLRHLGASDVRLLHGGWGAWLGAGGALDTASVGFGDFAAGEVVDVLATTEEVAAVVEDGSAALLDVRSAEEWAEGRIPGAVFLAWDDLTVDRVTLREPDEIRARLDALGLDDPEAPVITYCAGGIRAGHTFFVLELMGHTAVQDYVGSWAAWEASGGEVETDHAAAARP